MFLPVTASASAVYSGCAIPALKSTHHTFFVDPVKGSMSGDGSAAKPWSTLSAVLDPNNKLFATQTRRSYSDTTLYPSNPNAPIKPGDLILLKSGNHGSLNIQNAYNSDFITIAAAPGSVPVIGPSTFINTGKWMFANVTFEGMATTATGAKSVARPGGWLVATGRGDWLGRTSDIVFDADNFRSAASTSGWTDYDWVNKPFGIGVWISSPCVSLVDSHLYNLMDAISIAGEKSLIQGNTIEYFSNDGMDVTVGNVTVKNNVIRNGMNTAVDPLHADGIQGWSTITASGATLTNKNVVIDGNIVTKTGDPNKTYMQGISIFDGKWDGLVVQNNVVDVNTWNAVAIYGAQNAKVVNNTVISVDPVGHPSWLQVTKAKDGTASTGLVRNNIATQVLVDGTAVTVDHNMAASKVQIPAGTIASGVVGTANWVNPSVLTGFVTLNTTGGVFDMRLKQSSVAVGAGVLPGAPQLDILGKIRTAPVDLGAYVHESAPAKAASSQ